MLRFAGPAHAFPLVQNAVVIPWLDQPEPNPVPEAIVKQIVWEELDAWITPNDEFFVIKHYNVPEQNESDWHLEVGGLVDHPMVLTLADLKARERQEVTFTIECSGNSAFPFNKGLVSNATWAGTPLVSLLDEAEVLDPVSKSSLGRGCRRADLAGDDHHRAVRPQHVTRRRHESQ